MEAKSIIGTVVAVFSAAGIAYYFYNKNQKEKALLADAALAASQAEVDAANKKVAELEAQSKKTNDAAAKVKADAAVKAAKAAQVVAVAKQAGAVKRALLFQKGDSVELTQNMTIPCVVMDKFGAISQDSVNGKNLARFFYKNVPIGTVYNTTKGGNVIITLADGKLGMVSSAYLTIVSE